VSDQLEHEGAPIVAPSPQALPDPVIDPADVQALIPGTSLEDATRCAQLATLALQAALYPNPIPDPLPPPVQLVGLTVAGRLVLADSTGAPVVSESIGAYSYRLSIPDPASVGLWLTTYELLALGPWMARSGLVDLDTSPWGRCDWPADWWQRNLDELQEACL
jgi:hypothetical protein